MAPHQNWLGEMVLTRGHNICFNVVMWPVSPDPIEANYFFKEQIVNRQAAFLLWAGPVSEIVYS